MSLDAASRQQLEVLYTHHHGWLRSWLRHRLGNAFDAADLAHDTYLRVLGSGRLPPPERSRQHLTVVAKGLVIDLYRRRRIEAAYLESIAHLPEARVPSEEARALALEALIELDALLAGLPARAREALLLNRLDGLSHREIAQRMRVSVSSVEKYIAAALAACYRALHEAGR